MVRPPHPALYGALALPEPIQSALHPQTIVAQQIAALGWVMIVGAAVVFLVVLAFTVHALAARADWRAKIGGAGLIVGGGVVFPVIVLSALLVYGLRATDRIVETEEPAALRIEVVGEQFWWRVRYLDQAGGTDAATANEIHIPVGRPVDLYMKAADVIHSFWVPNLAGKIDMIPGRSNRLRIEVEKPGVWRGQCAEYCGAQHAKMAFFVVAENGDEFAAWLQNQRRPAREPGDAFRQRGKTLFLSKDCGQKECCADCHSVRGTAAKEDHGPDLTHVGGRRSIVAGMLPNNPGTLAGWIASSQHLKPGSHMPSFDRFSGEDLRALASYLESLQ